MTVYDSGYESLLQGVSQQTPIKRINGQLSEQLNMVSDALTGLRRRKGFQFIRILKRNPNLTENTDEGNVIDSKIGAGTTYWDYMHVSGAEYLISVECITGTLTVYSDKGVVVGQLQDDYLKGKPDRLASATVSGYGFILNKDKIVEEVSYQNKTRLAEGFLDFISGEVDYYWTVTFKDYVWEGNTAKVNILHYNMHNDNGVAGDNTYQTITGTLSTTTTGDRGKDIIALDKIWDFERDTDNSTNLKSYSLKVSPNNGKWYGFDINKAFGVTSRGMAMQIQQAWVNKEQTSPVKDKYNIFADGSSALYFLAKAKETNAILKVETSAKGSILRASGLSTVYTVAESDKLPVHLPADADSTIVTVGFNVDTAKYYQYEHNSQSWQECTERGDVKVFNNMPFVFELESSIEKQQAYISTLGKSEVFLDFSDFTLRKPTISTTLRLADGKKTVTGSYWFGRHVGNAINNPTPEFVGTNFTGIGGYQGRLVLLNGSYVHLSASNKFHEFTRKSLTAIEDDDAIHVASINASGLEFQHAIEFNKDLVLISESTQAVISGSNYTLTPKNTSIHRSGVAPIDCSARPIIVGKDLLYGVLNNSGYSQVGQLQVNNLVENQFNPFILSQHLPKYYKGNFNFIAGTALSGTCVFGSKSNKDLLVWQYLNNSNEVVHSSFSKWSLPYEVQYCWFNADFLYCLIYTSNEYILCRLSTTKGGDDTPYLDLWQHPKFESNGTLIPASYMQEYLLCCYDYSALHLDKVGLDSNLKVVRSFKNLSTNELVIGIPYESKWSPTPPSAVDNKGITISEHASLIRYILTLKDSGVFNIRVSDKLGEVYTDISTALTWSNTVPGKSRINPDDSVIIPCRTLAHDTTIIFSTNSVYDHNIISLGYTIKLAQKRKRYPY